MCGKSGFTVNQGAVNRGITVVALAGAEMGILFCSFLDPTSRHSRALRALERPWPRSRGVLVGILNPKITTFKNHSCI